VSYPGQKEKRRDRQEGLLRKISKGDFPLPPEKGEGEW